MKKEDKELLLKDLCARLPYGVKVRYSSYKEFVTCTIHSINPVYNNADLWSKSACFSPVDISKIKPYLFPLSSMTEEQKKEYDSIIYYNVELHCERYYNVIDVDCYEELHDFYHKNHIDYRGLIPLGLAIDATNLNIY